MPGSLTEQWEARCEIDVGKFIGAYLRENEPPGYSELADRLRTAAQWLLEAGELNLAYYGGED